MISVVIPALNEEKEVGRCLRSVLENRTDQPPEILLVDGGSRDATLSIARQVLCRAPRARILTGPRGRGRQMNLGAREAEGEVLLFLHSDSRLLPDALRMIQEAARNPLLQAGCFRHRFDGSGPVLRLISILHDFRFLCSGVVYGDQGLFVRRSLFVKLGGFREERVMEDVEFSERLLQYARPVRLPLPLITSSRKFEAIGAWRALAQVVRLLVGYELGRRNPFQHGFFLDYR